jgi:RNase P subunit RPR2
MIFMALEKIRLDPMPVIAARRVDTLLALAKQEVRTDEKSAQKYVKLACVLAARHRLPMKKGRKHLFCKSCFRPWIIGLNVKVRLDSKTKRAIYTCVCGKKRAFPYSARLG